MELFPNLDMAELRITGIICLNLFVFVGGIYIISRVLTRHRQDSVIPALTVIGALVLLATAVSLYLDTRPIIPGTIRAKHESVETELDGTWTYTFLVETSYQPPGAPGPRVGSLRAAQTTFDNLRVGDEVGVRFWDAGGLFEFARLANRSTLSMLWRSESLGFVVAGLTAVLVGLVVSTRSDKTTAVMSGIVTGVVMITLIAPALSQWKFMLPLGEPQATAVATVVDSILYTEVRSSSEDEDATVLVQPFDLIEVSFVPVGWSESVLALDRVDADSVPFEIGGSVDIIYRTDRPRDMRLVNGRRTYLWKNPLNTLFWFSILGVIGLALFFGVRRRRLSKVQRAALQ